MARAPDENGPNTSAVPDFKLDLNSITDFPALPGDSTNLSRQPYGRHSSKKFSNTRGMPSYDKRKQGKAAKSESWKKVSVRHQEKFERLFRDWKATPKSMRVINGNVVCFKEDFLIGKGSYGTEVYISLGTDGIERAIKRVPQRQCQKFLETEKEILTSPNAVGSPRIVNYCFYDDKSNNDFGYLILNLYEQNLAEYIKEQGESITDSRARTMIRQILEGLRALHAREPRILHRDLKPTNILVDVNGDLLLSDFGIGRFFPETGATTYHTSNERGTNGWIACECINWVSLYSDEMQDLSDATLRLTWKEKSEIQVAGMVAFYILTNGKHPFGAKIEQLVNMCNDNPVGLQTYGKLIDPVVKDLLSHMLAKEQDKRPYVEQALKHPYFLSAKEQIKFLEAVGNEPEIKSTKRHHNCAVSQKLDKYPSKPDSLLPLDWIAVIHPDDLKTFCSSSAGRKPFNYDGSKYTQCLRLIRNVRQHWGDMPRSPLKGMGKATTLDDYFLQLFPKLPLVLHQITREHPDWKTRANLKEFFPVINRRAMSEEDTDAD